MATKQVEQTKSFCFRCNKDTPIFHSTWEGINSSTKTYWLVNFCPRCGTVTSSEELPFHYSNLIPRIGKVKSFLFVLAIGTPHQLVAWGLGGPIVGIVFSILVLIAATLCSRNKIYQVENCPYTRWGQYPELATRKETLNGRTE